MSLASSSSSEIKLLGRSAAFAMSLGAKELFHTNFLAFLLESDDPALVQVQLAIRDALGFAPRPGAVPRCAVWREKNNLDLVLVELTQASAKPVAQGVPVADYEGSGGQAEGGEWDWSQNDKWRKTAGAATSIAKAVVAACTSRYIPTDRVLIVEAKLKSVPNLEQLIEYDDKLAGRGISLEFPESAEVADWRLCAREGGGVSIERRLLSITGVSTTTAATAARPPGHWFGVKWRALQIAMSQAVGPLAGSPMGQTLTDYADALGALLALIDRVHQMCDDAHLALQSPPTYGAMRKQPLAPQFKSLRINDLLGKALFDRWLNDFVLKSLAVSVPAGWAWNSYVHYSNGVPGLGLEFVNDKFSPPDADPLELHIGIQIQNSEFRLFISASSEWRGLESWIAAHPVLLAKWFNARVFGGQPIGCRGGGIMPPTRSGRATNLKVFGVHRFFYSKYDIDKQSIIDVEREISDIMKIASSLAPQL